MHGRFPPRCSGARIGSEGLAEVRVRGHHTAKAREFLYVIWRGGEFGLTVLRVDPAAVFLRIMEGK